MINFRVTVTSGKESILSLYWNEFPEKPAVLNFMHGIIWRIKVSRMSMLKKCPKTEQKKLRISTLFTRYFEWQTKFLHEYYKLRISLEIYLKRWVVDFTYLIDVHLKSKIERSQENLKMTCPTKVNCQVLLWLKLLSSNHVWCLII